MKQPPIDATAERRARRFWTLFILMFFAGQGVLWTFALNRVIGDPSHAVVEQYDDFEARWEGAQADASASAALGWRAKLSADHDHLVVALTDAQGEPVFAEVRAKVFHKARAAEKYEVVFTDAGNGLSVGALDMSRSGYWRVRLTATRGSETFTDVQDVVVGELARR